MKHKLHLALKFIALSLACTISTHLLHAQSVTHVNYMVDENPLGVYADCNLTIEVLDLDDNVVSSTVYWWSEVGSFDIPAGYAVRATVSSIEPWPSQNYELYLGVKGTLLGTTTDLTNQTTTNQSQSLTYTTGHLFSHGQTLSDIEIHAMTLHL